MPRPSPTQETSPTDRGARLVAGQEGESANGRPVLVCFSHLRWDSVWQRPHHLLQRASRRYDVLFLEEPVFELGPPHLRSRHPDGITVATPVLPHGTDAEAGEAMQRQLLDALVAERGMPRVLWYYTPMAVPFSLHLEAGAVVYDNMDELSAFRGAPPEMLANEEELFRHADIVFAGGHTLWDAKRGRHPRVFAFPSSIDAAHFASARRRHLPEPADQRAIPRPRLGFFGVIDERFDPDLLDGMARLRPDWHFVMLGPVAKIDPAGLPRRPNIHWLGQKPYADLPAYLSGWAVGIMPFAINEATRFISPTKTPEFLAAGVPVVSTAIADVVRPYGKEDLVSIADTADAFVARAEDLMAMPRPPWLARVDARLAQGSWDRTWAAMDDLVDGVGREASRPARTDASAISLAAAG